jgi:hypothetical protein
MNIYKLWNQSLGGKLLVLFAFSMGCCLISAVVSSVGNNKPRNQVFIAPTMTSKVTATTPVLVEATPTLVEATPVLSLESAAQMICREDYVETFRVEGTATVTCNFNPFITSETMAVGVMMNFNSLARRAWEVEPDLLYLNLHLKTIMQDKLGNKKEIVTVKLGISQDLATQINWNNVSYRAMPEILASNDPKSSIWVHPAFEKAWLTMIANQ